MLSNNIIIEKATEKDFPVCYKMMLKLALLEGETEDSILKEKDFLELTTNKNPVLHALTAKIENNIVGIAIYYYRQSTWKGKYIHLEDLFVEENFRHLGIGKKLFESLLAQVKKENLKRLEWEVHHINEKAINFYKKLGATISNEWKICRIDF